MPFFDRTRNALSRYSGGVHDLAAPATGTALAAARQEFAGALGASYRDFLSQWNGGWLFHDDYELFGVDGAPANVSRIARADGLLHVGRGPDSDLFLDERERVLRRDADTGAITVEGSRFESWLNAILAREGLIYDHDGEFREEAFDGGEMSAAARRKRAQLALKADPDSPAWHEELGLILVEDGKLDRALAELRTAVTLEPKMPSAWSAIARLSRAAGGLAEAAEAFAQAATCEPDRDEQAYAWAQAARAAGDSQLPALVEKAAGWAAQAESLAPHFVQDQQTAAEHLLEEGDVAGALERLSLAVAVRPDPALLSQQALLRARAALQRRG